MYVKQKFLETLYKYKKYQMTKIFIIRIQRTYYIHTHTHDMTYFSIKLSYATLFSKLFDLLFIILIDYTL